MQQREYFEFFEAIHRHNHELIINIPKSTGGGKDKRLKGEKRGQVGETGKVVVKSEKKRSSLERSEKASREDSFKSYTRSRYSTRSNDENGFKEET